MTTPHELLMKPGQGTSFSIVGDIFILKAVSEDTNGQYTLFEIQVEPEQEFEASTWVQLRELPSPYSHDEALLLCQHSENEWIVWIPEYGEMILHCSHLVKPLKRIRKGTR